MGLDGVVRYFVTMQKGAEQWAVGRRYREWNDLHSAIHTSDKGTSLASPFPPKQLILGQLPPALRALLCLGVSPAEASETRAVALRLWASELCASEWVGAGAVTSFFRLDPFMRAASSR